MTALPENGKDATAGDSGWGSGGGQASIGPGPDHAKRTREIHKAISPESGLRPAPCGRGSSPAVRCRPSRGRRRLNRPSGVHSGDSSTLRQPAVAWPRALVRRSCSGRATLLCGVGGTLALRGGTDAVAAFAGTAECDIPSLCRCSDCAESDVRRPPPRQGRAESVVQTARLRPAHLVEVGSVVRAMVRRCRDRGTGLPPAPPPPPQPATPRRTSSCPSPRS